MDQQSPFKKESSPFNEYAAPINEAAAPPPRPVAPLNPNGYVGREGYQLVVQDRATLPPICVKTGQPATQTVKRLYYWSHPALLITILAGVLIYAILVMVLRKSVTLEIPLSQEAYDKRKRALTITRGLMILSVIGIITAIVIAVGYAQPYNSLGGIAALVGFGSFLVLLIAAIFDGNIAKIITPKKIENGYGWFKGASEKMLAQVPDVHAR